jgi:hypothetical protein
LHADKQLDKTWKTKHPKPLPTAEAKAAIIKDAAATHKQVTKRIAAFSFEKESVLSKGLDALTTVSKLMTNPLFQAVVAEGGQAAVAILHAEAADKSHHSGIWVEMLKQIYAIEQHSTNKDEEKKEFEEWLETYLAHSTVENPTAEDPTVEEPAVEAPADEEPTVEAPAVEEPAVEGQTEDAPQ